MHQQIIPALRQALSKKGHYEEQQGKQVTTVGSSFNIQEPSEEEI